jgi:hypothetical protein
VTHPETTRRRAPARRGGSFTALALAASLAALGCGGGGDAGEPSTREPAGHSSVEGDSGAASYRAIDVVRGGSIRGTVTLAGTVPADTIVRPTSDQRICGASLVSRTIERQGSGLGGVIVWLADIRTGKRIPLERRYELLNERCQLEPRVQGVLVGGTLNVRSGDPVLHRTRFAHAATDSLIRLVTENDHGQVVPVEDVLRAPGLLAVTCDTHPWTRAWIAVFDHPYFAVTPPNGTFTIDSIPPGRYRLATWHERIGTRERFVEVKEGEAAEVTVRMGER